MSPVINRVVVINIIVINMDNWQGGKKVSIIYRLPFGQAVAGMY